MFYVLILVLIAIPVVILGLYQFHKKSAQNDVARLYSQAEQFAVNNPDKPKEAIQKFVNVRNLAQGKNDSIVQMAEQQIAQIEKAEKEKEQAFQVLLATLDKRATLFAAQEHYDSAINVYQHANPATTRQLQEARVQQISDWKQKAAATNAAGTASTMGTVPAPPATPLPESGEKINAILIEAADHIVTGNTARARETLETIAEPAFPPETVAKAKTTIVTLRLLETLERIHDDTEKSTPSTPPMIRAIFALRKKELLEAQSFLRKVPDELLYTELMARARLPEEQASLENRAISEFAALWGRISKAEVSSIPKPEDCSRELQQLAGEKAPPELSSACADLVKLESSYSQSSFVSRYHPFFVTCRKILAMQPSAKGPQKSTFGDGKIIAVEKNMVFVEFNSSRPDPTRNSIGLFEEKSVFTDITDKSILAARVDVTAVLPFQLFGEEQATFQLPASQPPPAIGEKVLVGSSLKLGPQILTRGNESELDFLYEAKFAETPGSEWKVQRGNWKIENGQLLLNADGNQNQRRTRLASVEVNNPGADKPALIDLTIAPKNNARIDISPAPGIVLTVPPGKSNESGLFFQGHLAQTWPAGWSETAPMHRVQIEITPTRIRATADASVIEATIPLQIVTPNYQTIRIQSRDDLRIGSLQIARLRGSDFPRIVGVNETGTEILFHKGSLNEWKALGRSSMLFALTPKDNPKKEETNPVYDTSKAVVQDTLGNWAFALLDEPIPVTRSTMFSFTATPPKELAQDDRPLRPILLANQWNPSLILGTILEPPQVSVPVISLDIPAILQPKAYLHQPLSPPLVHPWSKEPLSIQPGTSVAVDLQEKNGLLFTPNLPSLIETSKLKGTILLSRTILEPSTRCDLAGWAIVTPPIIASRNTTVGWQGLSGAWKDRLGRLTSVESTEPPILQLPGLYWNNVQYDVDARIEKSTTANAEYELLLDCYLPFRQDGISFHLGTKGAAISGSRLQDNEKSWNITATSEVPPSVQVFWEPGFGDKAPTLKAGPIYSVRIRRAGDALAFYVNGKRLARVVWPNTKGHDIRLRLAAPSGSASLGKSRSLNLSNTTEIPEEEPTMGEFGYVLSVDGTTLLVDSDAYGLVPQGKVSVMKIDKVIKGEASKTILLSRIATGIISEVGPRTARITLTSPGAVEPGMKIMPGLIPEVTTITGSRFLDVDSGF